MRLLSFVILLALFSCQSDSNDTDVPPTPALEKELLGTWEIIDVKVYSPSYLGEDTTVTETITEADWSKVYGVKPHRTTYTNDGKLKRTHTYVNGQLIDVVNGLWRVKNDSLHVIEPNITFSYAPHLQNEKLELKGRIDWDRDGEVDDDYQATFRLVGRTE